MIHEVKHPLITLKLNRMRDEQTSTIIFRELLDEISGIMTYEVFKDVKLVKEGLIKTPTGSIVDKLGLEKDITVVPILRAGIGMANGVCNMLPTARIGHIGLYRDEVTLTPIKYYYKIPKNKDANILICDPMIATGNSIIDAIKLLRADGYSHIRVIALIAAPEGLEKLNKAYPEVDVFVASIDEKLNEKGYIIPGLGDAGDRIFGTI